MKTWITLLTYLLAFSQEVAPHLLALEDNQPPIVIRHDRDDSDYIALGKQFPAVCRVGERGGDGTLIAPKWILTAAHVAQGMFRRQGKELKIYTENEKAYAIEAVFLHPNFAPMQGADIALIHLRKVVKGIEPINLYKEQDEVGKPITIVGHGDFKTGRGGAWKVDGLKRAATNKIDEVRHGKIIFDFDAPPDGTDLEGTAGRGDSGGPACIILDEKPYVAGISSAGMPGKDGPGTYGAVEHYTRVSAYIDWIESTMKRPQSAKALSSSERVTMNRPQPGPGRIVRRPQGGPLPGLGLMLMEENGKIRIGGKADPLVPAAFRQVMFRPPAYIVVLNGESYDSLAAFTAAFRDIKQGESFSIQFDIQGKIQSFDAKKM